MSYYFGNLLRDKEVQMFRTTHGRDIPKIYMMLSEDQLNNM